MSAHCTCSGDSFVGSFCCVDFDLVCLQYRPLSLACRCRWHTIQIVMLNIRNTCSLTHSIATARSTECTNALANQAKCENETKLRKTCQFEFSMSDRYRFVVPLFLSSFAHKHTHSHGHICSTQHINTVRSALLSSRLYSIVRIETNQHFEAFELELNRIVSHSHAGSFNPILFLFEWWYFKLHMCRSEKKLVCGRKRGKGNQMHCTLSWINWKSWQQTVYIMKCKPPIR